MENRREKILSSRRKRMNLILGQEFSEDNEEIETMTEHTHDGIISSNTDFVKEFSRTDMSQNVIFPKIVLLILSMFFQRIHSPLFLLFPLFFLFLNYIFKVFDGRYFSFIIFLFFEYIIGSPFFELIFHLLIFYGVIVTFKLITPYFKL